MRRKYPRTEFCPERWAPLEKDIEWAKIEYRIDDKEVARQVAKLRRREFRRKYTDWDRVFQNWIIKSHRIGDLHRERAHHRPLQTLSDDERREDQKKFEADIKRLRVVK